MTKPYFEDDLDVITLGESPPIRSPGRVVLSGHDRVKDWDNKKAKGQNGASSALNGDPIGEFTATFYLGGDGMGEEDGDVADQFFLWDEFQRLIESSTPAGATPRALRIYHPDLARNHFTEVVLKKMGGMVPDGKGGKTIAVQFQEHRPAKPKTPAKAQGGAPAVAGKPAKPDPNAAAKAQLAALLAEAKKP